MFWEFSTDIMWASWKRCCATEYRMTLEIFCQGAFLHSIFLMLFLIPYVIKHDVQGKHPIWMALPEGCAACMYLLEVSV